MVVIMRQKALLTLFAIIFTIFSVSQLAAEAEKHMTLTAHPDKIELKKGDKFNVKLTIDFDEHWHSYSLKEQLSADGIGPMPTEIIILPETLVKLTGDVTHAAPKIEYDEGYEMDIETIEGKMDFFLPVEALADLDFSKDAVEVELYIQICDTTSCLPPEPLLIKVENKIYTDADLAPIIEHEKEELKPAEEKQQITGAEQAIEDQKEKGIFSFLWFAMGAGALALLTPCVFPMIPITVSFFTKRAEKSKGQGLRDSLVYALGIIFTFTLLGFVLALTFGATGIQDFATNPWVNLFIAAIFIVFALNLFGAFEIQMPTGLMNKLNTKSQGNGIGSVLLMGLTFSLTSFTCTVPFVGTALVSASSGEWFYPIIGMIGFSTVFAAPFFLLALFPSAMTKMPKAGGWMNNVKVVMGFLEIAAAIKFLSNTDLAWNLEILTRDLFLSIWIISFLLIVLYVIGVYKLPHDSPTNGVNSVRLVFAVIFGSLTFFFIGGMNGTPLGELDAFLPDTGYGMPAGYSISADGVSSDSDNLESMWLKNYEEGLATAKKENRSVFVDFTGWQCTNCRWMEKNMFHRSEIKKELKKMVLVKLYTDRRTDEEQANKALQLEKYNSVALPLYVILTADGKFVASNEFTRDGEGFLEFLKKGTK
jgi:thiol:disulfide interchange protein